MITVDDAHDAMKDFDMLRFWNQVNPHTRDKIATILVEMCNMPPNDPRERTEGRTRQMAYVAPIDRLRRFTELLTLHSPEGVWPEVSGMIALYGALYTPANRKYEVEQGAGYIGDLSCDEIVTASGLLSAPTEQKYLPQPGDEPCEDLHQQIAVMVERKRLR